MEKKKKKENTQKEQKRLLLFPSGFLVFIFFSFFFLLFLYFSFSFFCLFLFYCFHCACSLSFLFHFFLPFLNFCFFIFLFLFLGSHWVLEPVHSVHVVFMNHLDVGYNGIPITGFINNVLNVYFQSHFPRVLRLQHALQTGGHEERYIYTTHPWLVSFYLDCPDLTLAGVKLMCPSQAEKNEFIKAIHRGDITWHAGI